MTIPDPTPDAPSNRADDTTGSALARIVAQLSANLDALREEFERRTYALEAGRIPDMICYDCALIGARYGWEAIWASGKDPDGLDQSRMFHRVETLLDSERRQGWTYGYYADANGNTIGIMARTLADGIGRCISHTRLELWRWRDQSAGQR